MSTLLGAQECRQDAPEMLPPAHDPRVCHLRRHVRTHGCTHGSLLGCSQKDCIGWSSSDPEQKKPFSSEVNEMLTTPASLKESGLELNQCTSVNFSVFLGKLKFAGQHWQELMTCMICLNGG